MPQRIPSGYTSWSLAMTHALSPRQSFVTGGIDTSGVDMNDAGVRTGIAAALRAIFSSRMDSNVTLGPTNFRVGPYPPEALVFVDSATTAGGRTMDSIHSNTAMLVALSTARGGRRGRGRWFVPWSVTELAVTEVGVISGAEITAWNGDFATALTAMATAGAPLVLLHSWDPDKGQAPDVGGEPNVITSALVSPLVGTQRRRLGR